MFFGIIAILNVIFIVIFVSGEPEDVDNFRLHPNDMFPMQALTILNISGSSWKVMLCFLNSMITVTALSYHLIFSYSNKYKDNESF